MRGTFQDPQEVPEIAHSNKSHMYFFFPHTYILPIKFNLQFRHSNRLKTIDNKQNNYNMIQLTLKNMDLNFAVPLMCGYFSIINSIVLYICGWLTLWLQRNPSGHRSCVELIQKASCTPAGSLETRIHETPGPGRCCFTSHSGHEDLELLSLPLADR